MSKRSYAGTYFPRPYKSFRLNSNTTALIKNAVKQAIKYKTGGSGTRTNQTGGKHFGGSTTVQYDQQLQYKKRRMNRYKRRQWKKFSNKVLAVCDKSQGLKSVIFNDLISTTPGTEQTWCHVALYGQSGTVTGAEAGMNDLRAIYRNDTAMDSTTKIRFKSALVDITMQNTSAGTLEVDVYCMNYRAQDRWFVNLNDCFGEALGTTEKINAAGSPISILTRGATPFLLPQFLRVCGGKVITKRKYLISAGQCATYNYRVAKDMWIKGSELSGASPLGFIYKGLTVGFLIVVKRVNPSDETGALVVRNTRTYSYKKLDSKAMHIENNIVTSV